MFKRFSLLRQWRLARSMGATSRHNPGAAFIISVDSYDEFVVKHSVRGQSDLDSSNTVEKSYALSFTIDFTKDFCCNGEISRGPIMERTFPCPRRNHRKMRSNLIDAYLGSVSGLIRGINRIFGFNRSPIMLMSGFGGMLWLQSVLFNQIQSIGLVILQLVFLLPCKDAQRFLFNPVQTNMAFFGKLVVPNQEKKRSKPLQLLPVNNTQILQRFENTLVGRVLNLEVQENRVKALIGFLPTIWKCEGRVQGVEMGRGRFHFFKEEADLQAVLDNRPYHFDGWMNAIEKWVPTMRMDFPSSILFWIRILDLPEIYNEEKQLVRMGEYLGELLNWKVMEPYPMIQVMVECDAPLILFREIVSEIGEIFRIRFDYVKLQNHCKVVTETTNVNLSGNERGRKAPQREIAQPLRNREHTTAPLETVRNQASSSKRKPVRRDLTEDRRIAKLATKEWVRKSFTKESTGSIIDQKEQAGGSGIRSTTWYRSTEEEAAVAKLVYDQTRLGREQRAQSDHPKRWKNKPSSATRGCRKIRLSVRVEAKG
ncbi:unnamed protein product [Arabis nemorensis]|uniref:DUF4283 domain-containing protein n=1 Tax=Arabis nemorensis TaxID=586526 RepID=A0A565AYP1_9BRAS|nr:unnamed protein product [Arabis nemorensis]